MTPQSGNGVIVVSRQERQKSGHPHTTTDPVHDFKEPAGPNQLSSGVLAFGRPPKASEAQM